MSAPIANIDVEAGEIDLNINGHTERFAFKPKVEHYSQVKAIIRKDTKKTQDRPSSPTIEALASTIEASKPHEEIRRHNYINAKRRIQHKIALEAYKKEVEKASPTKKLW